MCQSINLSILSPITDHDDISCQNKVRDEQRRDHSFSLVHSFQNETTTMDYRLGVLFFVEDYEV